MKDFCELHEPYEEPSYLSSCCGNCISTYNNIIFFGHVTAAEIAERTKVLIIGKTRLGCKE